MVDRGRFKCFYPTDYLALIWRMAARRVRLSRLIPRALRVLRYVVRAALYSGPWIHPVTRMVPSLRENNFHKRLRAAHSEIIHATLLTPTEN